MDINTEEVVSMVMPYVMFFETLGREFAKSRFLVCASEYGMNDKESAELMKIADGIQLSIQQNGTSIALSIEYGDSPYLGIIQQGMPAPVSGGDDGTVTLPDGSQVSSKVPKPLQGQPLPEYAKPGEDVMSEVKVMMESLFKEAVESAMGSASAEISAYLKPAVMQEVSAALGGGS